MLYSNNADLIHLLCYLLGFSVSLICGFILITRR